MKKNLVIIIILLAAYINIKGQSAGVSLGGGLISSNSPSVSSYSTSIFLESTVLFNSFSIRLSILYAADYNQILPNSTIKYNPFIKGVSLKGLTTQNYSGSYYLDEGIGLLMINDRIFNNSDFIDYGFVMSIGAGFDLRNDFPTGFRIGAGVDYGFTFTNTYANYFSLHLIGQYYF
jgi:hypothetical protein